MEKKICFSCDYFVENWIMAWDFDYGNFPVCVDCMAKHNYYRAGV